MRKKKAKGQNCSIGFLAHPPPPSRPILSVSALTGRQDVPFYYYSIIKEASYMNYTIDELKKEYSMLDIETTDDFTKEAIKKLIFEYVEE